MGKVIEMPSMCTVRIDNDLVFSDDFIAILSNENGETAIYYYTDTLTLGLAIKIIASEFIRSFRECSLEEQEEIRRALGDVFIVEGLCDDE